MKRLKLLLPSFFIALTLAACSKSDKSQSSAPNDRQLSSRTDRGVTASDQPENDTDRKIIQQIRQALTSDSSLSMSAQNVTVVSSNGNVTLRGGVKDDSEKQKIATAATRVSGVTNVDNLLTVTQ
jgi:hyperosmotically inducible periplasmic protein